VWYDGGGGKKKMLTILLLACKSDEGLQDNNQKPDQEACECPDNSADVTALQEELNSLRDRVVTLEGRVTEVESRPSPDPEPVGYSVVSTYQVDCRFGLFLTEFGEGYPERLASGTLSGYEGIYHSCPLVVGVPSESPPIVTAVKVIEVDPDVICGASSCPSTSSDVSWYNSQSGGRIVPGGYDDVRLAPTLQLRHDLARGVIYTSSDLEGWDPNTGLDEPQWYQVTVLGDRAFTAPEGW
jgi:hypothetical protein